GRGGAGGAGGEGMLAALGVSFLAPDLGMQAFDELMRRDVDQIAIAVADWPTYAGKAGRPPFLAELVESRADPATSRSTPERVAVQAARMAANGQARHQVFTPLQHPITPKPGFVQPIDADP